MIRHIYKIMIGDRLLPIGYSKRSANEGREERMASRDAIL